MKLITPQKLHQSELLVVYDPDYHNRAPPRQPTVFERLTSRGTSAANGRIRNDPRKTVSPASCPSRSKQQRSTQVDSYATEFQERRNSNSTSTMLPLRQVTHKELSGVKRRPKTTSQQPFQSATKISGEILQESFPIIFPPMPLQQQMVFPTSKLLWGEYRLTNNDRWTFGQVGGTFYNNQNINASMAPSPPLPPLEDLSSDMCTDGDDENSKFKHILKWLDDCESPNLSDTEDVSSDNTIKQRDVKSVVYSSSLNKFVEC